jgi:hypothetical protein
VDSAEEAVRTVGHHRELEPWTVRRAARACGEDDIGEAVTASVVPRAMASHAAHGVTNLALGIYVLMTGEWKLW